MSQAKLQKLFGVMSVLCLVSLIAACGGGSTTGPSDIPTPTPTPAGFSTLTFTGTLTGQPVSGARVTVAGTGYITNGSGQITLATPASAGTIIDASAGDQYLDRATWVRSAPTISLWQLGGADASFTQGLVYNQGTGILRRPVASVVYIQLTGELATDSATRSTHVQAAAMATAMTGNRVRVEVNDAPPAGSVVCTISLNPALAASGMTSLTVNANKIVAGRIEYLNVAVSRAVIPAAHEMGHLLGFGHPSTGIMCPNGCGARDFSSTESEVYTSMSQRLPGTSWPDNDRNASAASAKTSDIFSCDIPHQ